MSMTKKHFIALATALGSHRAPRSLIEAVADVCADASPGFDRQRFLFVCEHERRHAEMRDAALIAELIRGEGV